MAKYGDPYSELVLYIKPTQGHAHSSEHTHTHTHTVNTPGAVGSHIAAAPGEQLGAIRCLAQGSHLSRGIGEGERERWLFTPKSKWLDD